MFCKECGAEIPDDAKHCRECGAKLVDDTPSNSTTVAPVEKESFFKKNKKVLIGCCIGLIVIFLLVAILSNGSNSSYDKNADKGLSEKDFKAQCKEIDFNKLNKNADKYKGEKLKVSGKIIQIMENSNGGQIRLATADYSDDVVYVEYEGNIEYVEDDYITVYGYCDGDYTYTSTIGASITLPKIDAVYFDGA
ncbi:zinc-ribbon domain-containing protein [Methanobrevibacter sp.]|uniref:zinc-ribbon domain-containing protein n=1 Tax=Methanobrevibacter sp. TaxID=66852 RepID=UPI003864DFA2